MNNKYFYLNVNGFCGKEKKTIEKLNNGLYCWNNYAQKICKRIIEGYIKYDIVFFSEFAPNTPTGEEVTEYFIDNGYKLILPDGKEKIKNNCYSIVVAFVRNEIGVTKSKPSPEHWLTWCEIEVDNKSIIVIHSTRIKFLEDMKKEVETRKENWKKKNQKVIFFGDTNVTDKSDEESRNLLKDIINNIGEEIVDNERKETFIGKTKPDRVFSNCNLDFVVVEGFIDDKLSDHDGLSVTVHKFIPSKDIDSDIWCVETAHGIESSTDVNYIASEFAGVGLIYHYMYNGVMEHTHSFDGILEEVLKDPEHIELVTEYGEYSQQQIQMVEGIKNAVEFVRLHGRPMTSAELQEK